MSEGIPGVRGLSNINTTELNLGTYDPTPKSSAVERFFGNAFKYVKGALGTAQDIANNQILTKIDPEYAALIERQLKAQEQMQLVSMYSNIEKSKHETEMSAIRNIRVG